MNMLNFTPLMQTCVSHLRNSTDAVSSNQRLLAWFKAQHLSEEVTDNFRRNDSGTPSFNDPATRTKLRAFAQGFEDCVQGLDRNILDGTSQTLLKKLQWLTSMIDSLLIHLNYNKTKTLEVVLYLDHEVEDFRPPYLVRSMHSPSSQSPPLSPVYVRTIFDLIAAARGTMDVFLNMSPSTVRAAPIIHYIRVIYAMTILLELYMCSKRTGNELDKIIDAEVLWIEHYMSNLQKRLEEAAGREHCRTPEKFKFVLRRMATWYSDQHKDDSSPGTSKQDLRPLAHLEIGSESDTAHMPSIRSPLPLKTTSRDLHSLHSNHGPSRKDRTLRTSAQSPFNNPEPRTISEMGPIRSVTPSTADTDNLTHPPRLIAPMLSDSNLAIDSTLQPSTDASVLPDFDNEFLSLLYSTSDSIANSFVPDYGSFEFMDESLLGDFTS